MRYNGTLPLMVLLLFTLTKSNTNKAPKTPYQAVGKTAAILGSASAAAAFATAASYVKFQKEEEITNAFKQKAFQTYIHRGNKVLEIGFGPGNGANFDFYPAGIDLYAIDPLTISEKPDFNAAREKYKRKMVNLQSLTRLSCEDLSVYNDNTFDVVVSTLVLCSVQDQEKSINEIIRVLKRGGFFVTQEHIYAKDTFLGKTQEIFDVPQQIIADGCHLTRQTDEALNRRVGKDKGFTSIVQQEVVSLDSHWPISRQLLTVYTK